MQAIEEMTDTELDEAVALEVMEWQDGGDPFWEPHRVLHDAWQVIQALRARDIYVYLDNEAGSDKWEITLYTDRKGEWNTEGCWNKQLADLERQPSATLAICRGALMAVRTERHGFLRALIVLAEELGIK
ncbi:MAG: hypothetical protein KKH61_19895 [Gammaproteobacteria bacterium]|nr:hypothetical protein [Gammaproteobacteria bacterium]